MASKKNIQPFYKNWFFWILIAVAVGYFSTRDSNKPAPTVDYMTALRDKAFSELDSGIVSDKLLNATSSEDERDELFVKKMSEHYKVKLFSTSFNTSAIAKTHRKSIEETARNLRYDWFNQIIETGKQQQIPFKYLLTAHHADDNIETVVMNFFRGTGIKGLRGILPKQNKIVRPLLFANRKEI